MSTSVAVNPVVSVCATIKGRPGVPLIMSNKQTADPLNPFTQELKKLTGLHAKKKTEAVHRNIAKLQYRASFYLNENEQVVMPAANLEGLIRSGSTKSSKGKDVKAFVLVPEDALLLYEGPKSIEKLYANPAFVSHELIPSRQGMVSVTRPKFLDWSITFDIQIDTDGIDVDFVREALEYAGRAKGLGAGRPRAGRFTVESWEVVE